MTHRSGGILIVDIILQSGVKNVNMVDVAGRRILPVNVTSFIKRENYDQN